MQLGGTPRPTGTLVGRSLRLSRGSVRECSSAGRLALPGQLVDPMHWKNFLIRPARADDRAALYDVCLQTGDNGADARHLFEDPLALGQIYVGPYLEFEPDFAFAAQDQQGVCGYVLGALDSKRFYRQFETEWLPALRREHAAPSGPPDTWNRTQEVYHFYYQPRIFCPEPYGQYPSHLHIDLLPRAQGQGLGKVMLELLMKQFSEAGSPGVHLGMGVENRRAEGFYKRLGFEELTRRAETLYMGRRLPPTSDL